MSVLALFVTVRAPACRLTSVLRVRAGGRPMLTSAEALRCFLETLKDHEESIADLRHSYVPAARVRGPYGCVREAITAVGGFEAARIADGPATVEAYCAKAAKIRERVQCDTALKDVVEQVDAWVSGRHSDPSQRSRILGDMVSLLLLDAKAERVMRAARRSTIARAGRGVCRGRPAPPKRVDRPRPRAAAAGIISVFAYPCRVVFPLRSHPAHCTNMRAALASVHGW